MKESTKSRPDHAMPQPPAERLQVYYGGSSAAMRLYRWLDREREALRWFDVDAEGGQLPPNAPSLSTLRAAMHVYDPVRKRWFGRLDALRMVWRRLPALPLLAALTGLPGLRLFAELAYEGAANARRREK